MTPIHKKSTFLVSVCMITYNHEPYIAQAIEGVLNQKTKFSYKLIIGDDCSTDKTLEICKEYEIKFPNIIEVLPPLRRNIGIAKNLYRTLNACNGEYIAFCEGDDYWTDPMKLEWQINYLKHNPDIYLTCHRFKNFNGTTFFDDHLVQYFPDKTKNCSFDLDFFFDNWITKPVTIVFRTKNLPLETFRKYKYFRDVHLLYHILKCGNGVCLPFYGAVYRIHQEGVFSKLNELEKARVGYFVYKDLLAQNKDEQIRKIVSMLKKKHLNILMQELNKNALNYNYINHLKLHLLNKYLWVYLIKAIINKK